MPGVEHRSMSPIVRKFCEIIRGKKIVDSLRFADCLAARTQPPPQIPGGPCHKISGVYYFPRDVRRMVQPPVEILSYERLEAGKSLSSGSEAVTPGKIFIPE